MSIEEGKTSGTTGEPTRKRKSPFTPPNNNLSEDELLLKSFVDLMQIKADRGEFDLIVKEPDDRIGITRVLRPGLVLGGIVATASFAILRTVPKRMLNRSLTKTTSWTHGRVNPYYHMVRREKNPLMPRVTTNRDGSTTFREGWLMAPFLIAVDAAVSLVLGGLVSYWATPKVRLFEAAADIPLVPGRSAVSEVLCEDFVANYKKIPKRVWTNNSVEGDDVTMNLKRFIDNCRRRQQVERQLRSDAMLDRREPVAIPHPGVPRDLILDEDEEGQKDKQNILWGQTSQDKFWLDDDWEEEEEDFWGGGE